MAEEEDHSRGGGREEEEVVVEEEEDADARMVMKKKKKNGTKEEGEKGTTMMMCEGCSVQVSRYKCPACSFRSCSLPCVRAHKLKTSCSGKRDRTSFLPVSAFDDSRLLSGTVLFFP